MEREVDFLGYPKWKESSEKGRRLWVIFWGYFFQPSNDIINDLSWAADDVSDAGMCCAANDVSNLTMVWAADMFLKFNLRKIQNMLTPRSFAIWKNSSPSEIFSTSTLLNLLTPLTHYYKTFNPKGTLKYLVGLICAPVVDDSSVDVNIWSRFTFYPP